MAVRICITDLSSLPENDQMEYQTEHDNTVDWVDLCEPGPSEYSNRGQKLRARDGVRWVHRGKLGTWTERRSEFELREREDRRIDAFQHASVEAMLEAEAAGPGGMGGIWRTQVPPKQPGRHGARYGKRARTQLWDPEAKYDLVDDDPDNDDRDSRHASTLAMSLLVPVLSARGLLESKLLKQVFRNPHLTALNRAALNLIENENVMSRALGRCFSTMERIPGKEGLVPEEHKEHQHAHAANPMDIVPPLAHINDLFITNEGLPVPAPAHQDGTPSNLNATYIISPDEQREIVCASLKCLNELHADSREYMERLSEVRTVLAQVRRDRKHMWDVLRRWALEREEIDFQAVLRHKRRHAGMDDMYDAPPPQDRHTENMSKSNNDGSRNTNEINRRTEWTSSSSSSRSRGKRRSGRT